MKESVDVLILGAGPAGLSCAYELLGGDLSFSVIEKNAKAGGLCRTLSFGDFRTDIGPHRFFSRNQQLYHLLEELLGERLRRVDRFTRFYIDGSFFLYPVDLKDTVAKLGLRRSVKILSDYVVQKIKNVFSRKPAVSFEEQAVRDFGRSLAELNMLNYTEKIWGMPPRRISRDWLRQRVQGLSVCRLLTNYFLSKGTSVATVVDRFLYPEGGTGEIYRSMRRRISEARAQEVFRFQTVPVSLCHKGGKILQVVLADRRGKRHTVYPGQVVSSIPITQLCKLLDPKPPPGVLQAASQLSFRSHLSLFITLRKPAVFPDQWLYFPEKRFPFGRIMEPRNFSSALSPPGTTSLLVEYFCWESDPLWRAAAEDLLRLTMPYLAELGFAAQHEVLGCFLHRERYAYPVYDIHYRANLIPVKDFLKSLRNLQLVGRSGAFRYNNQDHALQMGMLAGRNITSGRHYDLEQIGTEELYFEHGLAE